MARIYSLTPAVLLNSFPDKSAICFHLLNTSRGPAAWGHRAQMSRTLYRQNMQEALAEVPNLEVRQGSVLDLVWQHDEGVSSVSGVRLGEFLLTL